MPGWLQNSNTFAAVLWYYVAQALNNDGGIAAVNLSASQNRIQGWRYFVSNRWRFLTYISVHLVSKSVSWPLVSSAIFHQKHRQILGNGLHFLV
jgi:hypothetical protein